MPLRRALDGILAGDFNDPTNERLIYLSAAGLAVVGLGLLVLTLIWWRRGRQEHPSLAPLEVMSSRAWANAPEGVRRRKLENVRVSGAAGSVEEPVVAEPVDLEALVRDVPYAFDDLREPSAVIAVPAVAAVVADGESVEAEPAADAAEVVEVAEVDAVEADSEAEPPVEPDGESKPDAESKSDVESEPKKSGSKKSKTKSKSEPVKPDVDATSISTERPVVASESPARVPVESSE